MSWVLHFGILPAREESTLEPSPLPSAALAILLPEGEEPGARLVVYINNILYWKNTKEWEEVYKKKSYSLIRMERQVHVLNYQ